MNGLSDEPTAKFRKVRKGTHSCQECRRRKVKCIFASTNDSTCIVCRRRGTRCVSQGELLRDEVDERQTPGMPPTPVSAHSVSVAEPSLHGKTAKALLDTLPCQKDIQILLGRVSRYSTLSYRSNFKSLSPEELLKEQIQVPTLLHPETHPVLLGRQMLLFAAALQHISPNAEIPGLNEGHRLIMERLAESAIRMVTSNDELLGTLEGLENIILESFYHIDSGNIRRAWITLRRAVMAAHLMGLHQPGHYRFKLIDNRNSLDPAVMWVCVVSMERFLSLLLGLPTSTADAKTSTQCATNGDLSALVMHLTSRILHRNQLNSTLQAARDMTKEIDQELIQMTEKLPPSFWRPLALAGLEVESVEAFWESRRAMDHMCYYMLVNQLHLPYILCQSHNPYVLYSRLACLSASREILARQIAVRTFNPVTAYSRIGDFLALTAGMTLMLVHIVSHGHKEIGNSSLLIHERLSDRAAVEQALDCMKSMLELQEDVLAAKCAVLLRELLVIEAVTAQGRHSSREHTIVRLAELSIQVPYLGAVRVSSQGITITPHSKLGHHSVPSEGASVTLGGLGSIHVQSPTNPANAAPQVGNPSLDTMSDNTALQLPVQMQDQMFPDAAAGVDNWVFQGFDTAYFDTLFRGLGEQLDSATT
ncbi:predicted protein [Aspergillus nidulans FGSC A4]|uniref:Zn(II)2Cys6 transcription factor (Eurofung) n=1 Tax=Emericella nidulans (strain FGSC A4 / ATCC 38163 / CBS 112.46 / NRRL 194 / M139) TaxID=227321 RepID=Q5ATC0_EMENI|nr:hypothetical protein [Aspergillus nidulans FGSC A4]EAA67082.1 predicted protein [Aspergillus nidulans FGSC A4]CBF80599.1 TPA: Putative Zn(II)2Cys6 transcription factor (Eurofung) [Aspergillus nidulans FGSC A4]|eukprot:XP_681729.1 predicted protein [Aspergillus nidulans FGSC A4]